MVFSTISNDMRIREMNERLKELVTKNSDFKFILIDDKNKEVPAHMLKIASNSLELTTMIYGLDSKMTPLTEIKVDGISSDDFIEIVRYMYEDYANINENNVYNVLTKSTYFGIKGLEKNCIEFISKNLNVSNIFVAYTFFCTHHGYYDIKLFCEKSIQSYGTKAFSTNGFLEIPLHILREILKFHTIKCPEKDVFKFTLLWAANQCALQKIAPSAANKRKVLNGAEKLVRYCTLPLCEFRECLNVDKEFFSPDEIQSIEKEINENTYSFNQRLFYDIIGKLNSVKKN